MSEVTKGLEGVEVDTTAVSSIDGEAGELRYRGYRIEDLVERSLADVAALVIDGELPDDVRRAQVVDWLADRELPAAAWTLLGSLASDTHPMGVLQAAVALLGDRDVRDAEAVFRIAAKIPTVVAGWVRVRSGENRVEPDPSLSLATDYLRMLLGAAPDDADARTLETVYVLQMEHGFNAGTFAGRVVASTLAPLPAVLSACVGALAGSIHGGADEAAYRMALEIAEPSKAAEWVDAALARKEKIMGLGHREYRVVDPRAVILKPMARALADRTGHSDVVETLIAVDEHASRRFAERGKRQHANVEFYKGAVLAALGFPVDTFTCVFASARVFGWGAHALEQWADNRIYRPQSTYVGPAPR